MGHLPRSAIAEIRECFAAYGLPEVPPPGLSVDALMAKMAVDKKNEGGAIRCTIITGVGTSIDHPLPVPREMMESVVKDMVAEAGGERGALSDGSRAKSKADARRACSGAAQELRSLLKGLPEIPSKKGSGQVGQEAGDAKVASWPRLLA